ncbi:uncharacterized protein V1510DRAFT_407424 [Dipodascopsis tothii]|uniref:uncharacterized protein n=1 Tax=Dipodascopsis tothii TaxID=44089 RepID=UPI0034CFE980
MRLMWAVAVTAAAAGAVSAAPIVVPTAVAAGAAAPADGLLLVVPEDDKPSDQTQKCERPSDGEDADAGELYDDDYFAGGDRQALDHAPCRQMVFRHPQQQRWGAGDLDELDSFDEVAARQDAHRETHRQKLQAIESQLKRAGIVGVPQHASTTSRRSLKQMMQGLMCLLPDKFKHYMICNN